MLLWVLSSRPMVALCDGPQAFKGTPHVGTSDFRAEAPLLDALDEAFYELQVRTHCMRTGAYQGASPGE